MSAEDAAAADRDRHSAPQSAADRLRETTRPSEQDRSFIRGFVVCFVSVVALGALGSYLINPYGHFAPTLFVPRVPVDRDLKLGLIQKASPDVVVVGSSRVKKLDPGCIRALTGKPAFNFGVDGGSLDDVQAVIRVLTSAKQHPAQILLGIDPGLVASVPGGVSRQSMWSRDLSKYIDTTIDQRANALGEMLWSQDALRDDLITFRRGRQRPRAHHYRDDGFLETPNEDAAQRSGTYDLDAQIGPSVARLQGIYAHMNVDPKRVGILRATLASAKAKGIEVLVFIPPVHPRLARALANNPNGMTPLIDIETLVKNLEADGLVRYTPTTLEDIGGDPADFVDADHMNTRNTTRLLEHLYGRRGLCAVQ